MRSKNRLLPIVAALIFSSSFLQSIELTAAPQQKEILINNRILLKVAGESISTVDVIRKLDLIFYKQFSDQYGTAPEVRYQFYLMNWNSIFRSLVEEKLLLADAKEKKIEVTEGDVREELLTVFGNDSVVTIEENGMDYESIWQIIKTQLIVKKMMGGMVHSKAIHQVNPKDMRKLYQEWLVKNPPQASWKYQVLTLRSPEINLSQKAAESLTHLLSAEPLTLSQALEQLKETQALEGVQAKISEEYSRTEGDISANHKAALQNLTPGSYSPPIFNQGSASQETVLSIFALKEHTPAISPTFQQMTEQLREELLQQAISKEAALYLSQLQKRFGINDEYIASVIPDDFMPFQLK